MTSLATTTVRSESDLLELRKAARQLCALFEVSDVHSVRFATAISEVVRLSLSNSVSVSAAFVLDHQSPQLLCQLDAPKDGIPTWHRDVVDDNPTWVRVKALVDHWSVDETESGTRLILGRKLNMSDSTYQQWLSGARTPAADLFPNESAANPPLPEKIQEMHAALNRSKRHTAKLRASARSLDLAIELAEIGIVEFDSESEICRCNERAGALLSLPEGSHPLELIREATKHIRSELLESLFDLGWTGSQSETIEWRPERQWISAKLETPTPDRPRDRILVMLDISERVAHARELDERVQLEQQLVGIVSHDLKSPLSTVSLTLDTLEHGADPAQLRPIALGKKAVRRAERMIFDLLDFTRDRLSSSLPIDPKPTNFKAILQPQIESTILHQNDKHLEVSIEGDVEGQWDAARLAQVVSNLLENALAYSPKNSQISFRVDGRSEDDVVFEVHNFGEPIGEDFQKRLFRPFARQSTRNQSDSLGLGMYIVKLIVAAHGGDISVQSGATEGTTFTVRLPRRAG